MVQFMFTTGIENSYPTIQLPSGATHRVDEMEKCGHYERWQEDFRLVKELGIDFLRRDLCRSDVLRPARLVE